MRIGYKDAEIDIQTFKAWVNILETLGIIFLLHPYSNNVLKRTIKTPKVYFYDTGLVCYLTKWSSPEVAESGAMSGALLENFAVSEIVKGYQNAGLEPYLYFYRDRDAKENPPCNSVPVLSSAWRSSSGHLTGRISSCRSGRYNLRFEKPFLLPCDSIHTIAVSPKDRHLK